MSNPGCRTYRELLGVYVLGAIEPVERSLLESHLTQCHDCKEELAGLAVLPALLHRVPPADAERIAGSGDADPHDPSADLLASLLRRAAVKRRTRRIQALLALAAAIIVAVSSGVAVSRALAPTSHPRPAAVDVMDVSTAQSGPLAATVRYDAASWGTTMWVRVEGFPRWIACKFWVQTKDGRQTLAGGWIVGPNGDRLWYPVDTGVAKANLTGFVITSGHRVLLRIPAS